MTSSPSRSSGPSLLFRRRLAISLGLALPVFAAAYPARRSLWPPADAGTHEATTEPLTPLRIDLPFTTVSIASAYLP
jgi:hypothetical protein